MDFMCYRTFLADFSPARVAHLLILIALITYCGVGLARRWFWTTPLPKFVKVALGLSWAIAFLWMGYGLRMGWNSVTLSNFACLVFRNLFFPILQTLLVGGYFLISKRLRPPKA